MGGQRGGVDGSAVRVAPAESDVVMTVPIDHAALVIRVLPNPAISYSGANDELGTTLSLQPVQPFTVLRHLPHRGGEPHDQFKPSGDLRQAIERRGVVLPSLHFCEQRLKVSGHAAFSVTETMTP